MNTTTSSTEKKCCATPNGNKSTSTSSTSPLPQPQSKLPNILEMLSIPNCDKILKSSKPAANKNPETGQYIPELTKEHTEEHTMQPTMEPTKEPTKELTNKQTKDLTKEEKEAATLKKAQNAARTKHWEEYQIWVPKPMD